MTGSSRRTSSWTAVCPDDVAAELRRRYEASRGTRLRTPEARLARRQINGYLYALAERGWLMAVIGEPIGLDRRAVHQRITEHRNAADRFHLDLTSAPLPDAPTRESTTPPA